MKHCTHLQQEYDSSQRLEHGTDLWCPFPYISDISHNLHHAISVSTLTQDIQTLIHIS